MQPLTTEQRKVLKKLVMPLIGDLHRVAYSLSRDRGLAEELVAETVAKACESFSHLRDHSKAKQWLLRILSNSFVSNRRYNKRHKRVTLEKEIETMPFSLFETLEHAFRSDANPERQVIAKLMDRDIQNALASLPEDYRLTIILCDVEGYAYDEIAKILQIPIGTVRSRVSRARILLQKQLWKYVQELNLVPKENRKQKGALREKEVECNC